MSFPGVTAFFGIVCSPAISVSCWSVTDEVAGYSILSIAAGEAHILNICVHPDFRSLGYGEKLLDDLLFRARSTSVREIFLEVRPSNEHALALYKKKDFHKVADRPAYYQASHGREDANVLVKKLTHRQLALSLHHHVPDFRSGK